jgi:ABC-type transporter Mla subunit MlaD
MIALVIIVLRAYAAFVHKYPWSNPYELKASSRTRSNLAVNSPVARRRRVGKVTKIETKEGSSASVVSMAITDNGLPLHKDAEAKIRPRIFLEGNFFVDLGGQPGTPALKVEPVDSDVADLRRRCRSTRC